MIDKETKEAVPVTAFLKGEQLAKGHREGQRCGAWQVPVGRRYGARAHEDYDPFKSPTHFKMLDLMREVRPKTFRRRPARITARSPATGTEADIELRRQDRWNFLFIAGMWFQDLFNYDFRRTEPLHSFRMRRRRARSASVPTTRASAGRNIIEKMHRRRPSRSGTKSTARHEILRRREEGRARHDRAHPEARCGRGGEKASSTTSTRGHRQDRSRGETGVRARRSTSTRRWRNCTARRS